MIQDGLGVVFTTNVKISDPSTGEVLLDKSNAIHPQNMSRIIARALANEPNSTLYRMAFGNGGSFVDVGGNIILNPPNDGSTDGWQARLYNETYSEILHGPRVGEDPGSWGPNVGRVGGGAVPEDDPVDNTVFSLETGKKSVIVARCYINPNEPRSQLPEDVADGMISPNERAFEFDELGFYSSGAQAKNSPGYMRINVGNATSDTHIPPEMYGKSYTLIIKIDGSNQSDTILIPDPTNPSSPVTGSGSGGELTYGDLCEGINTGSWLGGGGSGGGSPISNGVKVYITERSQTNTYPTIAGMESYGYLVFESKTVGDESSVWSQCTSNSFLSDITGSTCDITFVDGSDAGLANSTLDPTEERERLLTHITFPPILKKADRTLLIQYNILVSVVQTGSTVVDIAGPMFGSPPTSGA